MLSPSCVVACANLQWRPEERGGGGALPTLTASDFTVFSVKPRDAHLSSAVTKFRSIVQVGSRGRDSGRVGSCSFCRALTSRNTGGRVRKFLAQ